MTIKKPDDTAAAAEPGTIQNEDTDERLTVYLPQRMARLLRLVAAQRKANAKGRPNYSAIIATILEQHRTELEAELSNQRL